MALSGNFTGTTANKYIVPKIIWTATQSISGNYSDVVAELRYSRTNNDKTYGEWYGSITINGTKIPSTQVDNDGYIRIEITKDSNTLAMKTPAVRVPHNSDGSKSITISAAGKIAGTSLSSTTISKTVTLDTIPRKAAITAAPDFTDEQNPKITYNNSAGNAVSSLKACISLDGSKDDIEYRDISKTGNSYTFNLTTAERNVLRNATTTANSREIRFYIQTEIAGETYRSSVAKTLTIVNAKPTINPTVKDIGSASILLTGDADNKVIKDYNNMSVSIGATALKGATIKSQKVENGSKSFTAASGNLRNVSSGSFKFTVVDSRGNTTTKTVSKTLINYVKLTCNLSAAAPTTDGVLSFSVSGNYFNGSFGAVANTLTVQYRLKENDGSYSAWTALTPTITNNTYRVSSSVSGLDYRSTYIIQARALDKIYNDDTENAILSAERKLKTTPVFDWGENDFNFNVPVRMENGTPLQGKGTDGNVNMIYTTTGTNNIQIGGGAYPPKNIFINTENNEGSVSINGKAYGVNRVLWQGSYYMTEGQTAELSEPVSEQTAGIVLVFSRYDISNSDALNEHFSCHFVPKQLVALQAGKGSVFTMNTVSYSYSGSKYLYIDDTAIRGNTNNDATGTGENGITFNNNRFVLRYVIGV